MVDRRARQLAFVHAALQLSAPYGRDASLYEAHTKSACVVVGDLFHVEVVGEKEEVHEEKQVSI